MKFIKNLDEALNFLFYSKLYFLDGDEDWVEQNTEATRVLFNEVKKICNEKDDKHLKAQIEGLIVYIYHFLIKIIENQPNCKNDVIQAMNDFYLDFMDLYSVDPYNPFAKNYGIINQVPSFLHPNPEEVLLKSTKTLETFNRIMDRAARRLNHKYHYKNERKIEKNVFPSYYLSMQESFNDPNSDEYDIYDDIYDDYDYSR